jgi:hypothetical protein
MNRFQNSRKRCKRRARTTVVRRFIARKREVNIGPRRAPPWRNSRTIMRLGVRMDKEAATEKLLRDKRIQIRKKLSAVLSGLDTLLADEDFLRLLRAAKMNAMPKSLQDRALRNVFAAPEQEDLLNLVLAKGYVSKIMENARAAAYIRRWATQLSADIESLTEPAAMDRLVHA